ncbi:MAG TPA: arylesterase [Methylomirabilota bacterium]|nr:arylesterase [Methylomirabilota bacterium]
MRRSAARRVLLAALALFFVASVAPAQDERVIVAFGDSLTAGYGVAPDEAYPALLEARLRAEGYRYRVINAGVSGDTTAGGLRRVDWALRSRPDIVLLELGANDALRGLDLGQVRANLDAMVTRFEAAGVRVLLLGMRLPPNYGTPYAQEFERLYQTVAGRRKVPLMPFFLDGVAAVARLNQPDGIHPTPEGYRIVVDRLWPHLQPLLKR